MKGEQPGFRYKFLSYLKCLFLASGIYSCFLSFGYFLEKLLKYHLDEDRVYSFPIFIVVVTTFSNLLTSTFLLSLQHNKKVYLETDLSPKRKKSELKYRRVSVKALFSVLDRNDLVRLAISSSFCVLAQMTSTYALPRVGIPTQVIIKSSKMVPILVGGFVLFRKKYAWYDVCCVISVTLSIVMFNFSRLVNFKTNKSSVLGIFMCFLSLLCDGFVGPIQDNVLSKVDLHPHVLMFITNLVSLPLALFVCLLTEGSEPFYLLFTHDQILKLVGYLAFCGSFGQVFVFLSLKNYGSLYTGIITTLRKAFSTLLSVYIFKHKMTRVQWLAVFLTFSTIFLQQYFKNKSKQLHYKTQ